MGARRFFIEGTHAAGDRVRVNDADAHKIREVLRLREGDALEIVDSAGTLYAATIADARQTVSAVLDEVLLVPPPPRLTIDVAQGIPKGQKMDFVVEKLSELGVSSIIPLCCERSVVRDAGDAKIERWRRLARSAAQQSGRHAIANVTDPAPFDALCATFASYDAVLFPWEVADARCPLRETLPALVSAATRILVVIGPEGGFSHDEAEHARSAGAHVVSLGSRIVRTETAALVLVAIVQYLLE